MVSQCALPACFKKGANRCSICLRESYCSGECQKVDWKFHKLICKILKKLSDGFQPYHEVSRVIDEILDEMPENKELGIRILGHLISYAERQFGNRILGKAYRERNSGERIDNWGVEIKILVRIYDDLISIYKDDESLTTIGTDDLILPYYEKMLNLLKPWSEVVNLDNTSRTVSLDKDQMNHILMTFSLCERNMASIYTRRSNFNLAEKYCQRALANARYIYIYVCVYIYIYVYIYICK
jgi:hypothetical protein